MDYVYLVPITLFVAFAATAILFFYYRQRINGEVQQTIREALAQGQQLTPELLEGIRGQGDAHRRDLRRGIISAGVGLGILAFALILGEEDAVRPISAISSIPFVIGLAYLSLWAFRRPPER